MRVTKVLLGVALTGATAMLASGGTIGSVAVASSSSSPGVRACVTAPDGARIKKVATVKEPALYPPRDAKKYGVIKDAPRMPNGSVHISTVFHIISEARPTPAQQSRLEKMIDAQIQVLNDSYSGQTAPDAADSPFRFDLDHDTWTVNAASAHVAPGKTERDMKHALHEGDSTTLNVYAADIGGGLLGWAYFPKPRTTTTAVTSSTAS
jgi:hypothetical protein